MKEYLHIPMCTPYCGADLLASFLVLSSARQKYKIRSQSGNSIKLGLSNGEIAQQCSLQTAISYAWNARIYHAMRNMFDGKHVRSCRSIVPRLTF